MDVVNFTSALENSSAGLPPTAECRTKLCPLCCTANHRLSHECFNCGWHGAFCSAVAAPDRELLFGPAILLVKANILRSRWQALKNWLFLVGSHQHSDPWK